MMTVPNSELPAPNSSPLFHETQRFRQWWLVFLVGGIVLLMWGTFIQQIGRGRPVGNNPMSDWGVWVLWLLLGIGLPVVFSRARMETTVYPDRIDIHLWPLARRIIPAADIASVAARDYRPLREYGGWGIRGFGSNRAYNVSGDQGVELALTNGNRVLIGSQRPEALATAIERMMSSR